MIPPGSNAADITRWSIDRTPALAQLLDTMNNGDINSLADIVTLTNLPN